MKKLATLLLLPIAVAAAFVGIVASGSTARSPRPIARHATAPATAPATAAATAPATAPAAAAVTATNRLATTLLPRLGRGGNVVFSPYSIAAALAMADQGATGETATQIGHVLGTPDAPALGAGEATLASRLRTAITPPAGAPPTGAPQLDIANGIWVSSKLPLAAPFQSALARDFGAAPQAAPFSSQPDAARQAINSWVAHHTAQLIKNLMAPGSVSAMTKLVLANAIYLKAHWQNQFIKSSTAPGQFTTASGQHVTAQFMTQPPVSFAYARGEGYQAIELPYSNSTLSMLAVMPTLGTLTQFQRRLNPARVATIAGSLSPKLVDLRMPRLSLALHASLGPVLSALGMPIAFSDQADFSGITKAASLKIQAVEHGATLRVDEQGTVAAAATGIAFEPTAIRGGPTVSLTLNHPFLLFLRDDASGAILFAARVEDPTGS
jgi:serpin B